MKTIKLLAVISLAVLLLSCAGTPATEIQTAAGENPPSEETMQEIDQRIVGIWLGVLKAGGTELRTVFNISLDDDGKLIVSVDSPDQGVTGIPVEETLLDGLEVTMNITAAKAVFKGKIESDWSAIKGAWVQGGGSFNLELKQVSEVESVKRPQDPVKPYPYISEDVVFENADAGITLAGTLTLPEGNGPFPAAILITGSGPENRDEEIFNHRPFLIIADHLTRNGIAVLRFDDRGVGESTGNYVEADTLDFRDDVLAAIAFLQKDTRIESLKIGMIGHSEGGIIAPLVAAEYPETAFIVLLAAPGYTGEEILYQQNSAIVIASGGTEENASQANAINRRIYTTVIAEEDDGKAAELLGPILKDAGLPDNQIEAQINAVLSPWFRYFLIHDPAPLLSALKCPVLALNGEKDLQVLPELNLSAIETALKQGDNQEYLIKQLPGLNHLFQTAETGLMNEYLIIEETFSPDALKIMSDWLKTTL